MEKKKKKLLPLLFRSPVAFILLILEGFDFTNLKWVDRPLHTLHYLDVEVENRDAKQKYVPFLHSNQHPRNR